MNFKPISQATIKRLPLYLGYLKQLGENAPINISSGAISQAMKLNEIQVRKDLAAVSIGKPKIGYVLQDLIADIEAYLGYNSVCDAVIVGAGKLGKALMDYKGFSEYGLKILAAFDSNVDVINEDSNIYHVDKLWDLCQRLGIKMGIITVPAHFAQGVCNEMVNAGIKAIWNFAPVHLNVPDDVIVQNENLAVSLAVLSKHLNSCAFQ